MSITDCLATAKRLIADGDAARLRGDEPSRRQAVIIYDVAVEDALLGVAGHLGRSVPSGANRPEMCNLLADVIPSHMNAARLRSEIRNKAMHRSATPTSVEVETAHALAESVLRDAFAAAGYDYTAFTFVPLLANSMVREPLTAAHAAVDDEAPVALALVLQAWRRLEGILQEAIAATRGTDLWFFRNALWERHLHVSKCHDNAHEHALQALEVAAAQVLNTDQAGTLRLRQLFMRLTLEQSQEGIVAGIREDASLERTEVAWALDFVASTAYYLERANPNLRQATMAPRGTGHAAVLPTVLLDRLQQGLAE